MNKNIIILITLVIVFFISLSASAESNLILNFDDGYSGVYLNAFPVMNNYNIPGVFFVTTSLIDTKNHVKLSELKILKKHGWEIGSHTVHHPDLLKLTYKGMENEIIKSKDYLIKNNLIEKESASFCSPMSKWNNKIAQIVGQNYRIARYDKLIDLDNNSVIDSSIKVVLNTTSLTALKNWITKGQKNNITQIIVFHDINENANHLYNYNPDKFRKLINFINSYNIKVITFKELINNS